MRPDGTIPDLLKKLNLPVPVEVDAQHAALARFIYQFGITFFFSALRHGGTGDDIERMKVQRFLDGTGGSRRSGIVTVHGSANGSPNPPQSQPQPQPQIPVGQTTPAPAPLPATPPPQVATQIRTPDYEGPDRRSGVERRVGPKDRRAKLDVVYKNMRFGGRDRRKVVRRVEDRKKQGLE
jgi:hypothetical protein